jgi:hypothetical protein
MKIARRLTQRWRPKLVCLVLATGLWYIIKQNVKETRDPGLWRAPAQTKTSSRND